MEIPSQSRSHEWLEPAKLATSTQPLSGQEYLEAWANGELTPPMATTMGFKLTGFGDGYVEMSCVPAGFHYNPYGTAHGGLAATLLDSATGCAVQSRLPAGVGYATLNLSVSYLRPITLDTGEVQCVGRVVSMGRTVAVSEAEIVDSAGKQLGRATAT